VAYPGIVETAVAFLEMEEWDLNATNPEVNTEITWIVRTGSESVS